MPFFGAGPLGAARKSNTVLLLISTASAWLLALSFPVNLLICFCCILLLALRRSLLALLALVLLPYPWIFCASFWHTSQLYNAGSAEYATAERATMAGGLHPRYRVPYSYQFCNDCSGWLEQKARVLALEYQYRRLGPMPGMYAGAYPEHAEAFVAMEHSFAQTGIPSLRHFLLHDLGLSPRAARHIDGEVWRWAGPVPPDTRLSYALYRDECLLIAIPREDGSGIKHVLVFALPRDGQFLTSYTQH
ncbi:hypothetical protein IT575_00725 [bacterium]|nr:hypothetical protein [bacterium]